MNTTTHSKWRSWKSVPFFMGLAALGLILAAAYLALDERRAEAAIQVDADPKQFAATSASEQLVTFDLRNRSRQDVRIVGAVLG